MKGYKVFNPDWTTMNGFRWEIGKTYTHKGGLELCESGFHFCKNLTDCFRYYGFNQANKVAEIEALGKIEESECKCVTDQIRIIREIPWGEVLTLVNIGYGNTGYRNSGDKNSGDRNTGSNNSGRCNTGDWNTGDWNTGDYNAGNFNNGNQNSGRHNTGDHNTGSYNIGDYNSGSFNTGNFNTGDCNTGDFNACTRSTGFFNTEPSKIYMFNKPCDLTWHEINRLPGMHILQKFRLYDLTEWTYISSMSDEEKAVHPECIITKGYLKCRDFKDAFKEFWQELNKVDRQKIMKLPNFDPAIFKEITGVDVAEDYTDKN